MQANPITFTGSGAIENGVMVSVVGIAFTGFQSVVVHNGTSAAGDVVVVGGSPGTYGLSYELLCSNGVYIETLGSGKGTVWIAG